MKNQIEIVKEIADGMYEIGGVPNNEEFYTEFNMRVKDRLGIKDSPRRSNEINITELEILAKVLTKIMYYGNWQPESPNDQLLEYQMRKLGLYPFRNEDEMIAKTKIDEHYYQSAQKNKGEIKAKTEKKQF